MGLHKRSMLPVEMKEILSKISIMEIQMTTDWMMHSRLIKFYEKKKLEVEFTAFSITVRVDRLCLFWSQSTLCSNLIFLNMLVLRQRNTDFMSQILGFIMCKIITIIPCL